MFSCFYQQNLFKISKVIKILLYKANNQGIQTHRYRSSNIISSVPDHLLVAMGLKTSLAIIVDLIND